MTSCFQTVKYTFARDIFISVRYLNTEQIIFIQKNCLALVHLLCYISKHLTKKSWLNVFRTSKLVKTLISIHVTGTGDKPVPFEICSLLSLLLMIEYHIKVPNKNVL